MENKVFSAKNKEKLDSPKRREMLPPTATLLRFGLVEGDILADVGCGTGYFSFPAYEITKSNVYAIDLSQEMLDYLNSKKTNELIDTVLSVGDDFKIKDGAASFVLMSTVLHEIDQTESFIDEVARITANGGTLGIIEWKYADSEMGPKLSHRLSTKQIETICKKRFTITETFEINDQFIGIILKKK